MDTSLFLLKREEIQQRMAARRAAAMESRPQPANGLLSFLARTGADMVLGARSSGASAGWVGSVLWAVAAPTLMGLLKHRGNSFLERLLDRVLPSHRS
jgi:hypothetical protein